MVSFGYGILPGRNMHGGQETIGVAPLLGHMVTTTLCPTFTDVEVAEMRGEIHALAVKVPGSLEREYADARQALERANAKLGKLLADRDALQSSTDPKDLRGYSAKWGELATALDVAQGDVDDAQRLVEAIGRTIAAQRAVALEKSMGPLAAKARSIDAEAVQVREELRAAMEPFIRRLVVLSEQAVQLGNVRDQLERAVPPPPPPAPRRLTPEEVNARRYEGLFNDRPLTEAEVYEKRYGGVL